MMLHEHMDGVPGIRHMLIPVALLGLLACAQQQQNSGADAMTGIVPTEIRGWVCQDSVETFDRETIFDYIDGAGEVYLAYDFRKVVVFRFQKPEAVGVMVELFDMGSAEDAYGVFSYAREAEETGVGQGYELRGTVLCFWKSRMFVCVTTQEQTAETKELLLDLGRAIDRNIPLTGGRPELLQILPEEDLMSQSVRFFHTYQALNYHYFLSDRNILQLDRQTNAVLAQYEDDSGYLLGLEFPSEQRATDAQNSFLAAYLPEAGITGRAQVQEGKWVLVDRVGRFLIIVLDAPSDENGRELVRVCKSRILEARL